MSAPPVLRLPAGPASAELTERGSRFLAILRRVPDLDGAVAARDEARRTYHDATHHVFAARDARAAERFDDDGEPAGTAGRPILAELSARDVVEGVVVVARWYGGTKLGTGGLARAYRAVAAAALEAGTLRSVVAGEIRYARYVFADTGAVARVLESAGLVRGHDEYGESVRTEVRLPLGTAAGLDRRLRDATAGRAGLEPDPHPPGCWIVHAT